MEIQVKQRRVQVDPEIWAMVRHWTWGVTVYYNKEKPYITGRAPGNRKVRLLHRVALGEPAGDVDHINGDTLDNRKENLRACSQKQNSRNRGPTKANKTGFKGVFLGRGKIARYYAQICVDYAFKRSSMFETPEEAALAYDALAREHFGEFAWLNFPDNIKSEAMSKK